MNTIIFHIMSYVVTMHDAIILSESSYCLTWLLYIAVYKHNYVYESKV